MGEYLGHFGVRHDKKYAQTVLHKTGFDYPIFIFGLEFDHQSSHTGMDGFQFKSFRNYVHLRTTKPCHHHTLHSPTISSTR